MGRAILRCDCGRNLAALGELLSREATFLVVRPGNGSTPSALGSMMGGLQSSPVAAQSVSTILDWYRVRKPVRG
jgi:hypothetical protein